MRVVLGNRHAVHTVSTVVDGEVVEHTEPMKRGKRATDIELDPSVGSVDALTVITHPTQGVWAQHSTPGATPAWVASDNAVLADILAGHFGGIEVRQMES